MPAKVHKQATAMGPGIHKEKLGAAVKLQAQEKKEIQACGVAHMWMCKLTMRIHANK